jgi:hypothetical protein
VRCFDRQETSELWELHRPTRRGGIVHLCAIVGCGDGRGKGKGRERGRGKGRKGKERKWDEKCVSIGVWWWCMTLNPLMSIRFRPRTLFRFLLFISPLGSRPKPKFQLQSQSQFQSHPRANSSRWQSFVSLGKLPIATATRRVGLLQSESRNNQSQLRDDEAYAQVKPWAV